MYFQVRRCHEYRNIIRFFHCPSATTSMHAGCPIWILNELRIVQAIAENFVRHCSVYQNHFRLKGV